MVYSRIIKGFLPNPRLFNGPFGRRHVPSTLTTTGSRALGAGMDMSMTEINLD